MPETKLSVFGLFAVLILTACSSAYYNALESVGIPKRDVLVKRVEFARDDQEVAKEQFQTALQKFSALTNYDGGPLEEKYNELNDEYENSVDKADTVRGRIEEIQDVAEHLFAEWQIELDQYSNASMRRNSEQQLEATRNHYSDLIKAMRRAESKFDPVLATFHDQVLYLKHNLNAKAIASLETELQAIESDVAALVAEMEKSIDEANEFIQSMETKSTETTESTT